MKASFHRACQILEPLAIYEGMGVDRAVPGSKGKPSWHTLEGTTVMAATGSTASFLRNGGLEGPCN